MDSLGKDHSRDPIGVFDSGVGGLTVYKALRDALPHENFIYLGDTARLPYGSKSPDTVAQYALQAAQLLMSAEIKLLVVACNTASALALPALKSELPSLPVIGVIDAGAEAAAQNSGNGRIAIIATESTIRSEAYLNAIRRYRPDATLRGLACNLLVALAEEGWCEGGEAEAIINRYLAQLQPRDFDTLVLGCTHFPLLAKTIAKLLGPNIRLIDSAEPTTQQVKGYLNAHNLLNNSSTKGESRFWVTDSPERFALLAQRFLGETALPAIELANLSTTSQIREKLGARD
jgi:glutamate racemase